MSQIYLGRDPAISDLKKKKKHMGRTCSCVQVVAHFVYKSNTGSTTN